MKVSLFFSSIFLFSSQYLFSNPQEFLNQYCITCHGEEKQKGKLRLDQWSNPSSKLVDAVIDQLEYQEMPPEDETQPTAEEIKTFVTSILKSKEEEKLSQNKPFFRRFNHEEFYNQVMTTLAIPQSTFNPIKTFPQDKGHSKSSKQWDHLQMSEFYLKSLMDNIDVCVEKALTFSDQPEAQSWTFLPNAQMHFESRRKLKNKEYIHLYNKDYYSFNQHMREGVPHDGEYSISIKAQSIDRKHPYQEFLKLDINAHARLGLSASSLKFGPNLHRPQIGMTKLDEFELKGSRISDLKSKVWLFKGDVPRVNYSNGPQDWRMSGFRIIEARGLHYQDTYIPGTTYKGERSINLFPKIISEEVFPKIRVFEMTIEGPHYSQWPPKSHQKWFGKKTKLQEKDAWKGIEKFARHAFKRSLHEHERENIKILYDTSITRGESIEQATKEVFKAILCMPNFLYLFIDPDQHEQAKLNERLGSFFWSNVHNNIDPKLSARDQADLFLKDPKSWSFIKGFLNDWLKLDTLGHMAPDKKLFPTYYIDSLQESMKKETELLFAYLLRNNLSIEHLVDSDFLFVNRDLCRHYGIDPDDINWNHLPEGLSSKDLYLNTKLDSRQTRFTKIQNFDRRRGGLIGQASILTLTANGTDTNPIHRGVWFLESFLGQKPKLPLEDVPELEPDIRGTKTIREQLEKHRDAPQCISCHQKIDPPGFVLENYDPIGRWRNAYPAKGAMFVESYGKLFDQPFKDIVEFKKILLENKEVFAKTMIKHLMAYGLGREVKVYDNTEINKILSKVKEKNYGLRDMVLEVIDSPLFKS